MKFNVWSKELGVEDSWLTKRVKNSRVGVAENWTYQWFKLTWGEKLLIIARSKKLRTGYDLLQDPRRLVSVKNRWLTKGLKGSEVNLSIVQMSWGVGGGMCEKWLTAGSKELGVRTRLSMTPWILVTRARMEACSWEDGVRSLFRFSRHCNNRWVMQFSIIYMKNTVWQWENERERERETMRKREKYNGKKELIFLNARKREERFQQNHTKKMVRGSKR